MNNSELILKSFDVSYRPPNIHNTNIEIKSYQDTMPLVKLDDYDRSWILNTKKILFRPSSFSAFMTGMFLVDACKERGAKNIDLILPLFPGRQDRMNDKDDYLFTAKSLAKELNARKFKSVTIFDPHSDVTSALINNCIVKKPVEILKPFYYRHYAAVVAPDAGAENRAADVAQALKVPLFRGWKTRSLEDGSITGFGLQPCGTGFRTDLNTRFLVVDDVCDGNYTFEGLGQIILDRGFQPDLYVTHGLFTKGLTKLKKYYTKIITTDSVIREPDSDLDIIDAAEQLFEN